MKYDLDFNLRFEGYLLRWEEDFCAMECGSFESVFPVCGKLIAKCCLLELEVAIDYFNNSKIKNNDLLPVIRQV